MATVPINLNALMPQFIRSIPLTEAVPDLAVAVDLNIFQGPSSNLPTIDFNRIVEHKAKDRFAPKPYTIVELTNIARAWGITRPATLKADLVSQVQAEYLQRYPRTVVRE